MPEPRADNPPSAEMDRSIDDLLAEAAADIDGEFESVDGPMAAPPAAPDPPSDPEPEIPPEVDATPAAGPDASGSEDVEGALADVASDLNALSEEVAAATEDETESVVSTDALAKTAPAPTAEADIEGDMEPPGAMATQLGAPAQDEPDLDAVLEQAAADLGDLPSGSLDAPDFDAPAHTAPTGEASAHALLDADLQAAEVAHASTMSVDDLPAGDFGEAPEPAAAKPAASAPAAPAKPAATAVAVPVSAPPEVKKAKKEKKEKKDKKPKEAKGEADGGPRRSPVTVATSFVYGALAEMNAPVRQLSASTRDFVGILAMLTAFNAAAAWLVWLLLAGR